MKLSIITINYNNFTGLQKTIDSVLHQTYMDFEWIVIDGGSNDGSKEYLESLKSYFVYWCSEPDKGIYNALNKGLKYATGEYVLFLNSGDYLYDETTIDLVHFQINNEQVKSDIYYGDMIQVNDKGGLKPVMFPDELGFLFFPYNNICHQATFYKRSLFESNPYDECFSIVSDWAMNLKLLFQGCTFKHIKKYIVYYDNRGKSSHANLKHHEERTAAFAKYVPQQVQIDVARYEKDFYFSRHRKSTRILLDFAVTFCREVDKVLSTIEKRNKKINL